MILENSEEKTILISSILIWFLTKNKEIISFPTSLIIPHTLGNSWERDKTKQPEKRSKYKKEDIERWSDYLGESIKGDELSKKYTESIKKNNRSNLRKYDNFLKATNNALYFGSVVWCKNDSSRFDYDFRVNHLFKKSIMVLTIIKTLLDKRIIVRDSSINIYIDEETDDNLDQNFKAKQLKDFLMQEKNSFSSIKENKDDDIERNNYYNFNLLICQLRDANVKIDNLEYLESKLSFPIQMADIVANLTFKILNRNLDIENTINYFLLEKINIIAYVFPKFRKLNIVNNERCCT